jgi:uncharacterized protein (TIGR02284 family)
MAKDVTSVLNDLIETCKDGEAGFRQAADHVRNPELKVLLSRRAADCADGATQLQEQVSMLGMKPEDHGTASGRLHRGWLGLKSALGGGTDLAVMEECERGEDVAKRHYLAALDEPLPPSVLAVVRVQYEGVLRNHDQVKDIRDHLRATV